MKLFKENKPEVVLLDIYLPGNESFKILKEIKKSPYKTSVIILAADTRKYVQERCRLLRADFFFDKYSEFEKIPSVIDLIAGKD